MKKNYIIPETMYTEQFYRENILAESDPKLDDNGNPTFPGGDGEGGDAGDAVAKERQGFWENGGLWMVSFLFMLLSSGRLMAQDVETHSPAAPPSDFATHAMTIYLADGTFVEYTADDLSEVTYLIGVGLKITTTTTTVDYLFSEMSSIDYYLSGSSGGEGGGGGGSTDATNVNANWNETGVPQCSPMTNPSFTNKSTDAWAWRLEYPHINTSSTSQRVVKATSAYGITYSLEWDNSLIANRWTCYTMCAKNNADNVSRSDDFKEDPEVTTSAANTYTQSGTYSRGHLCPSADRLASTEQNKQTFFMTNMQPQYQNHNGGVWAVLEGYVRTKWQPTNSNDTLYVVKAATIADVTLNGSSSTGIITTTTDGDGQTLVVPKYFYMAFLYYNKSANEYKAFALWTEHLNSNNPSAATVINNRISIDELEARTGIDFFCNLPDDIENTVEATATYWDNSSSAKERFDDDFFVPEEEDADGEEELEIALW